MSTPWIIHQYAPSPNCERLRRVLVRLDLPFETKDYMPISDEARAEVRAFAERAQHNQMPVLERDGKLLSDSIVITEQLLREYPDRAHRVVPADPALAAQAHGFLLASEAGWLRPEASHYTPEYRERKGEEYVTRILANDHQRREWHLRALDATLADHPFLVGDKYSLGDIAMASVMNARINVARFAQSLAESGTPSPFAPEQWPLWDLDGDTYPHLRAWFDTCNAPEFTESVVAAA